MQKSKSKSTDRNYYRTFPWSHHQRTIFAEVASSDRNIAIEAKAGSGKTSTLKGIVHWLPSTAKIQIFAFNKSVAEKLEAELPTRVKVNTAHSYGLAMLMRSLKAYDGSIEVDQYKYHRLFDRAIQDLLRKAKDEPHPKYGALEDERNIVALRRCVIDLAHFARVGLCQLNFDGLKNAIATYSLPIPGQLKYWTMSLALECIFAGDRMAREQHIIDHDDMLYLPYRWNCRPLSVKDIVAIDEAQDTNAAMLDLYGKFVEDGARLIAIGDSMQSIMLFSGSLPNAFAHIKHRFDCKESDLPVCYRCPSSHLALASQLVPGIEGRPNVPRGAIATINRQELVEVAQPQEVIISRMTAPLVEICIDLVMAGKTAQILGKQLGEELALLAREVGGNSTVMETFPLRLQEYAQAVIDLAEQDDQVGAENLLDKVQALFACYEAFGKQCYLLPDFCDRVRQLFECQDPQQAVILSTIHRFKGGEADVVYLLNSDGLPVDREDSNQQQQELNLLYVALTRAKQKLVFVPEREIEGDVGGVWMLNSVDWGELPEDTPEPQTQTVQQLSLFS